MFIVMSHKSHFFYFFVNMNGCQINDMVSEDELIIIGVTFGSYN